MSSTMNLYEFLWSEGAGIEWMLGQHFRHVGGGGRIPDGTDGPFQVRVRFWSPGATTPEVISEFPVDSMKAFDVHGVVERMERDVHEGLGPGATGQIQVQVWQDGRAAFPILKAQRMLVAGPGMEAAGYMQQGLGVEYLKHRIVAMDRQVDTIMQRQNEAFAQMTVAFTSLTQAMTALATVRTATQAAGDLNGPMGVLALVALAIAVPTIQEFLDLPDGASVPETIRGAQIALRSVIGQMRDGDAPRDKMPEAPAGALTDRSAPPDGGPPAPGSPPAPPDGAAAPAIAMDELDAMVKRLETDEAFREALVTKAMEIPALKAAATKAMLSGGRKKKKNPTPEPV